MKKHNQDLENAQRHLRNAKKIAEGRIMSAQWEVIYLLMCAITDVGRAVNDLCEKEVDQ